MKNSTTKISKKSLSEYKPSEDICYSADDIIGELKQIDKESGFSKEVPFHQSPPYFHFPFSEFPNFKNGPL